MVAEALSKRQSGVPCPVPCFIYNIACVLVVIRDIGRDKDTTLHGGPLLRNLDDAVLLVLPDPSMVLQEKIEE